MIKSFASDNWSGVSPEIMEAVTVANTGHNAAYGEMNDPYYHRALFEFEKHFGKDIALFFVYNGTAANVLGINHLTSSYHAVITAKSAHINEDECAAPEKFGGNKILEIETGNGKITPAQIKPFLKSTGFQHHAQPKMISISQITEAGTVYSIEEIKAIADFAHDNNIYLHMDGARISNAAVALNAGFREFTRDAGVDVLSFGGTKNGLMFGEAVLFFDKNLAAGFKYLRKQGMQLHSKMRFIEVQFETYLKTGIWKKNARNANVKAKYLAEKLNKINGVRITQPVAGNAVFATLPPGIIPKLQNRYFFYVWDNDTSLVRLMCSWDTTKSDVDDFTELIKYEMSK